MAIKISLKSLYTGIMLVLAYHIVFVRFPSPMVQRIMAVILLIMILPKVCFIRKDMTMLFLLGAYSSVTLISSFINSGNYVYTHPLVGGIFHVMVIFEIFEVYSYALKVKGAEWTIRIFLCLSAIYVVCNDFLVICYPTMFRYEYLVGNKFSVSYKHIEWIVLYCMGKRKNMMILFCMLLWSMYISVKVNCMTGAVGIVILAVLLLANMPRLLHKRLLFCTVTGISVLFPFLYDALTGNYPVQYLIVRILNRTAGLTGRTVIFDYLPVILKGHWLLGYGYNTAFEVWITATDWYPNAQNGFWNCVCEQGIICAVLLTVTAVYVIGRHGGKRHFCYPLMSVVYVYAVLGAVEITMDITFVAWLIMLYMMKRGVRYYQYHSPRIQRGKIYC